MNSVVVKFYEEVEDRLLKFAVIISKYNNKLVYCKHKKRDTLEIPGGHREAGEDILDTAKWIPIAHDNAGNYVGVDLSPDRKGTVGQVINFGRDENDKWVFARHCPYFCNY